MCSSTYANYQQKQSSVGVLKNFAKFTGRHLCKSSFFNKVTGLRPATLLQIMLWKKCLFTNFAKFLRTLFPTEHLRWLLLYQVTVTLPFFSLNTIWKTRLNTLRVHIPNYVSAVQMFYTMT